MAPTIKPLKGFVLVYFFLLILHFSSTAQARIAIVGGVNRSTVLQTSNQPNFNNLKKGYDPRFGFHIGFLADFPLSPTSKFYFQPAIEYFNKGRKFSQSSKNAAGDSVYQTTGFQFLNYIDIPLNIVYKFELAKKIALIVGAGPYLSFFYSGKTNSTTLGPNNYYTSTGDVSNLPTGNDPGQYATIDYGLNALAGVDFGGSFITANFSQGLRNAYRDSTYTGSFKNQVFSITLGVYLGERKKKKPANQPDSTADNDCDGVIDKVDFCPTVPGLQKYHGCPVPDSDCDSVDDEHDKCPYVIGPIRNDGCPLPDTDGDSVNDEDDKCPTAKGLPQYKGCPIPIDETLAADSIIGDTMIYIIYYDPNKIKINIKGAIAVAKLSKLFKAHDDLNIKISGYSDKSKSPKIDKQQSSGRAINVWNYFKEEDMPASRMRIHYWGSTKASFSPKDTINKWQDRKVEIAVYQKKADTSFIVDGSQISNSKKTNGAKRHTIVTKNNNLQKSNYPYIVEPANVTATNRKHNIKSRHSVIADNSSVAISNTIRNNKINKNITGANHVVKNKKDINEVDRSNAVSYNPNKINNTANNNIPITAIVPMIKANGVITKDNRTLNNNKNTAYPQEDNKKGNKNNLVGKNKPAHNKGNSSATNSTSPENDINTNTAASKKTAIVTNKNTANNKLKNKSGATTDIENANPNDLSQNQQHNLSSNKTNKKSADITSSNKTLINESGTPQNNTESSNATTNTNKANNTVKNNSQKNNDNSSVVSADNIIIEKNNAPANNVTKINTNNNIEEATNNNSAPVKNNQAIEKTAAEKMATLDSLIALDKTISKKSSAPTDDTNKVLDCYTIYFDPNQAILNSASFDILDHIREILKLDSSLYIGISGYSEKIGSETSAQKISQERAYLTRDYMNSYGVTPDRMRTSYWGSKIPVANDYDPYQQWENRRVEICIYIYPK